MSGLAAIRSWKIAAVEPQGDDVAAGPDRMRPARAVDEFDLAETVARPQDVERDLVTGFAPFDHAGAAGHDDVERVGRLAFEREDPAERERGWSEAVNHGSPRRFRKETKKR